MRRYTDYQDSGSDWIGQVPKHWDIGRLKDFVLANPTFKVPHDMTADDLVEFVPMTNVDETLGVISRFDLTPLSEVASGYRRFCNGDVIFAKITPCMENGNCAIVSGLSRNIGFGSTEFLVYRPKRSLNARYLHYFLHNDLFRKNAVPFMKGSAGQKRLPNDYVETHVFPLPPLPEQQAIADYLDAKTAQIDRKIDLLTQKVAKYRQLKQALINAAVTRGLDQSAPMKDSGVEWIGEVPANWQMYRHKDCLSLVTNRCGDSSLTKVALENIEGQTGRYIPTENEYDGDGIQFRIGDILFGKLRPYLAKVYLAEFEGSAVGDIFVYRPKPNILSGFAQRLMLSKRYLDVINSSTAGAKMPRVSADFISDLPVFVPSLPEQHAIIQFLDDRTGQIDRIVEAINTQVDKLQYLRKSLINAVVTGKLRVT